MCLFFFSPSSLSHFFLYPILLLLISFLLFPHYLYLSLGLYPSSLLSLNLPSICLHLYLFLPPLPLSSPSFLRPRLSAAVQYSSITVVLIIPFSACSHTVIYQINNPSLLLLLCLPRSPSLSFLTVPSEGCSACQMSLRVKVPSLQPSPLIPVSRLLDALIKVTQV